MGQNRRSLKTKRPPYPNGEEDYYFKQSNKMIAIIRKMDDVMAMEERAVNSWASGCSTYVRLMDCIGESNDLMDELWDIVRDVHFLSRSCKNRRKESADTERKQTAYKVYAGEDPWALDIGSVCPACGDVLLHGPRADDWFCTYCNRMIHSPVPRTKRNLE